MWHRKYPVALLILALLACPVMGYADVSLRFGVYTADKPTSLVDQFRPLLNVLEHRLRHSLGEPVEIKMHIAKTYAQGIQDIATGAVDFAELGPASFMAAKQVNPALSFLAMESEKGAKVFSGVICVHKDSPLHTVSDLKGKSFAFGDEHSTIGRYLSQQYLLRHNMKATDLSHYAYLGRHDKVGSAVGAGQFDAGALKELTFQKLVANGVPLRAIALIPSVTRPWVAHNSLPVKIFEALRQALLTLNDPTALKALGYDGFLAGSEADYASTQEAMQNNGLFFNP